MNNKGENLETYTSPKDAPRDRDKMLANPLLNKVFLQPSNDQNTKKKKKLKRQENRLGV